MENTIRWRTVFDKEGNAVKESNAKLVRWSDGSMSLHLGAEVFDVYKQPLQVRAWEPVLEYKEFDFLWTFKRKFRP